MKHSLEEKKVKAERKRKSFVEEKRVEIEKRTSRASTRGAFALELGLQPREGRSQISRISTSSISFGFCICLRRDKKGGHFLKAFKG